jgi:hypothetical protein
MKEFHCKEEEEQGAIPHRISPRRKEQGRGQRTDTQQQANYQLMSKLLGGTVCHLTNKSDLEQIMFLLVHTESKARKIFFAFLREFTQV